MLRSIFCLLWKNFKWQERLHICKCEIFATWIPSDNVYSLVLKKAKEINIARRSSNGKKFSHNRWPKTNSHLQIAFFPILSFFIIEKITSGLFFLKAIRKDGKGAWNGRLYTVVCILVWMKSFPRF